MARHVSVVQDTQSSVVDYLALDGPTLVASYAIDYHLAAGFRIVADGEFNADGGATSPQLRTWDLVAQNVSNPNFPIGQLDFLYLDNHGNLIGSALTDVVPSIRGEGNFGTVPGQAGPALVSQLPDGSIDMLAFNSGGHLIASDLIPGTIGLPRVVGVADFGDVSTSVSSAVTIMALHLNSDVSMRPRTSSHSCRTGKSISWACRVRSRRA
jgi:hypothetical protein